jgi:hypothetical protein
MKFGSVTTGIIADGLVFNMDAANRASYPIQRTLATAESGSCFNTIDLSQSGSFISDPQFITQPTSASCWNFDGVDDNIDTTTTTLGDKYSVSLWFKNGVTPSPYLVPLGANTSGGYVILLGATTGYWYYGNGSSARATVTDSAYTAAMSDTSNWHHLILVRNAPTNGTALYSDGEVYLDGTLIFTQVDKYVGTTVSSVKNIGDVAASTSYPYNGNIANIHLYNRALSSNEVLHNYNALKGRFGLT